MTDEPAHGEQANPDAPESANTPEEMEIDGTLDLHMFRPRDVKDLVTDYVDLCLERGILELRIIHGKGIGALRETVRKVLDRHPAVVWYGHPSDASSWGATVVRLEQPPATPTGDGTE